MNKPRSMTHCELQDRLFSAKTVGVEGNNGTDPQPVPSPAWGAPVNEVCRVYEGLVLSWDVSVH